MKENLIVIKTLQGLTRLTSSLVDSDFVTADTETDGTQKDSRIIGFSVCDSLDRAFYVILSYWDVEKQALVDLETKQGAEAFFTGLLTKKLIMHNAIFDCWMIKNNFGVDLMPSVHTDTMLLAHLVDENRRVGLKELGASMFGESARKEQIEMKASVSKNGGVLSTKKYELYKGDADLIAKYGAKDALLTMQIFVTLLPQLYAEGLEGFFYEDETMPLLRGTTYDLNTTGLKIDTNKLAKLRAELEVECEEAKAFIHSEIKSLVEQDYPGTKKNPAFNIEANKQLAWLLFTKLGNTFNTLTKEGRALCKGLGMKVPYSNAAKRQFIELCTTRKGQVWQEARYNPTTKKQGRPKKIGDPWTYMACGKESLKILALKYKWVAKLLAYKTASKILDTYVIGIQERAQYGVIRPSFLQHGTTSGRYSSKNPNFQNLPRKDKRIKSCIVAREGKVFVGSDFGQLEPRVFASFSGDERLLEGFRSNDDFYSIIGMEVFEKFDCTPQKEGSSQAFGVKYPALRDSAKVVALSAAYGTTAFKMAGELKCTIDEAQEVIDSYFTKYPKVQELMVESHRQAITSGRVTNLFGRPRRMPEAMNIPEIYGSTEHARLPYEARNTLNLAINHRIQSTGASIMNRASIALWSAIRVLAKEDKAWNEVKIVLQIHDELVLEGPETLSDAMAFILKHCMEETVKLPGVGLVAEPKVAKDLASLK